jgi:hypothetical protein
LRLKRTIKTNPQISEMGNCAGGPAIDKPTSFMSSKRTSRPAPRTTDSGSMNSDRRCHQVRQGRCGGHPVRWIAMTYPRSDDLRELGEQHLQMSCHALCSLTSASEAHSRTRVQPFRCHALCSASEAYSRTRVQPLPCLALCWICRRQLDSMSDSTELTVGLCD